MTAAPVFCSHFVPLLVVGVGNALWLMSEERRSIGPKQSQHPANMQEVPLRPRVTATAIFSLAHLEVNPVARVKLPGCGHVS